ncbi:hypothetical protein JCM10213_006456 [Rhodosporidiobolus nylandii]
MKTLSLSLSPLLLLFPLLPLLSGPGGLASAHSLAPLNRRSHLLNRAPEPLPQPQYGFSPGYGGDSSTAPYSAAGAAPSMDSGMGGGYGMTSGGGGGGGGAGGGGAYDTCMQQCMANNGMSLPGGGGGSDMGGMTGNSTLPPPAGGNTTDLIAGPGQVVVAPKLGDLRMVPFNLAAKPGSTVQFVWGAGPHTVTQSSALTICNASKAAGAFTSGMQLKGFEFDVMVNDTKPIWYYCTVKDHCQKGMFGVINAPTTSDPTKNVKGKMGEWAKQSQENQILIDQTVIIVQNSPKEVQNWGWNLDISSLPSWALSPTMESTLKTRQFFAQNPQALAASNSAGSTASDGSSTSSSSASSADNGTSPVTTSAAASSSATDVASSAGGPLGGGSEGAVVVPSAVAAGLFALGVGVVAQLV